jgi:hypothetical protein
VGSEQEISANHTKLGAEDARRLAREASKIMVAKGKKVLVFDMKKDPPDDDVLLAAMLGPTGNLRAPTIRRGATILVGFDEEMYRKVFE